MSQQWTVYTTSATQIDTVNVQIQQYLNDLRAAGSGALNSVKVTTSDMNHGDAWGVVVSASTPIPQSIPPFTGWNVYEFQNVETNYQEMFEALQTAFNTGSLPITGTPISAQQIYFSQISMTNRQSGDATLTLFYPSF